MTHVDFRVGDEVVCIKPIDHLVYGVNYLITKMSGTHINDFCGIEDLTTNENNYGFYNYRFKLAESRELKIIDDPLYKNLFE